MKKNKVNKIYYYKNNFVKLVICMLMLICYTRIYSQNSIDVNTGFASLYITNYKFLDAIYFDIGTHYNLKKIIEGETTEITFNEKQGELIDFTSKLKKEVNRLNSQGANLLNYDNGNGFYFVFLKDKLISFQKKNNSIMISLSGKISFSLDYPNEKEMLEALKYLENNN